MSAVCLSSLKDRLCVAWTAEALIDYGDTARSRTFGFQNLNYFLAFHYDRLCRVRLVRAGFAVGPSFSLTVLAEKPDSVEPLCQMLACDSVSELPWECTFPENFLHRYASPFISGGEYWNRIRFVFIFQESDPASVPNDIIERPIQAEIAQGASNGWEFPSNLENLSLDFANLLKNETLPDVRLKCGGRDGAIPAHRSVLAARSEVFAAMFRNEMAESRSGEVDVPDMDGDVVQPFLQYVYSGRIPSGVSDEVVPGLYAAADKYAVHALRETCRQRMVSCLTEDNCVNFLTLADAHGDADFKKSVIDFICGHRSVFKGEAWQEFAKKPSLLAMEVYQSKVERET